ncbi:cytochrome c oxidase subunit II [uncultured Psychrosphaera sp.]|uniref:cytochrome c oxidase subunit II n=1 Tax=uncultured Psychrosphaera sp. TaxID=1403522 RepID=UPI003428CC2C
MRLNMTKGVTDISASVYNLHMIIFYICCVIGIVVFGIMFWSIIHHRKSKGAKPANFHESTKVEILWTAIPFVILIAMAFPATKTLIEMEDTTDADLTVQVTGSQWKWHYKYFEHDLDYYSLLATPQSEIKNKIAKSANYLLEVDRPLVIPTGQKVRFLITSDDVIHSWWVPEFAIKKDANPGFINEAWTRVNEPGIYRGQCAELCGKDHGFMPIVVIAKEPAEFDKWMAEKVEIAKKFKEEEQKLLAMNMPMEELMALGEKVYNANCAACHQQNGQGIPGVFPGLKDSAIALGDVKEHIDIVVNGKAGTAMQAFGKQLALKDLAAIVTYERNAWGNNTGDVVQAAAINEFLVDK